MALLAVFPTRSQITDHITVPSFSIQANYEWVGMLQVLELPAWAYSHSPRQLAIVKDDYTSRRMTTTSIKYLPQICNSS